jgi:hypothetical protein
VISVNSVVKFLGIEGAKFAEMDFSAAASIA